jgi:hypothetical protein
MSSVKPIPEVRIQKSEKRNPELGYSSDFGFRISRFGWGRWLSGAFRIFNVRLRFFIILLALFLLVGQWDTLWNYWEKLSRTAFGHKPKEHSVASDIEFWCPMCPGVVSDWPAKCPVCNMALVQRKKHEMVPLPDGVMSRMQLSPYRIQLAGIQTSSVSYQTLTQEITTGGYIQDVGTVSAEVFDRDLSGIRQGQPITGSCDALQGRPPYQGRVQSVKTSWVGGKWRFQLQLAFENPSGELKPGMFITAQVRVPPKQWSWYTNTLMENWRDSLVAETVSNGLFGQAGLAPGAGLETFGRAALQQIALQHGLVPAIPESAVVDTGRQKIVFVESGPGIFDAVEVLLGPKYGPFYVLVRGPESGQRIVTTGAFLIDAESRLNPAAASLYFGSGSAPQDTARSAPNSTSQSISADDQKIRRARQELSSEDQRLVDEQDYCPVQEKNRLGSMGKPLKVLINNTPVFLCCDGCQEEATAHPGETLIKVEQLKQRVQNSAQRR